MCYLRDAFDGILLELVEQELFQHMLTGFWLAVGLIS